VERIELPSTKHRMICARSARLNLFILTLCVSALTTVCHSECRGIEKRRER
jgi:hypothetical protein